MFVAVAVLLLSIIGVLNETGSHESQGLNLAFYIAAGVLVLLTILEPYGPRLASRPRA